MLRLLGKTLLKLTGWRYDDVPDYWHKKQIIIGFPHTSNMDTIIAFCYNHIIRANAKVFIKSDWFFWPMSSILKPLGGFPVERDKGSGLVKDIIHQFNKEKRFIIAIVPEGTRKKTKKIKTGFWNMAKGANVPVLCLYYDGKAKRIRWVGHIRPGNDLVADLLKIKALYKPYGYELPLGDLDQYYKK